MELGSNAWWQLPDLVFLCLALVLSLVFLSKAFVHPPSVNEMARLVDRQCNLQDRLSTATELLSGAPRTTMEQLQVRDAASFAAQVVPSKVVRISPSWRYWLPAGFASGAALLICFLSLDVLERPNGLMQIDATAASVADASTVLANLLGEDPRFQGDPYIAAVAKAIEDFAMIASTDESGTAQLESQLGELLGHLYQALEGKDPASRELLDSYLSDASGISSGSDTTISTAQEADSASEGESAGGTPIAVSTQVGQSEIANTGVASRPDLARYQLALEALVESLQDTSMAREERQGSGRAAIPSDIADSYEFLTPEMQSAIDLADPKSQDASLQTAAAGVTIGASADANEGGGNQAGDGAQPMFAEDSALPPSRDVGGQDLVLAEGNRVSGATRRADTRPIAGGEVTAQPVEADSLAWEPIHQTSAADTMLVGLKHRELVSRYFMPGER